MRQKFRQRPDLLRVERPRQRGGPRLRIFLLRQRDVGPDEHAQRLRLLFNGPLRVLPDEVAEHVLPRPVRFRCIIVERTLGLLQHVRERPRIEPQQRRNADEQGQKTRRETYNALHPAAVGKRGGQHGDHAHRHNGGQIAPDRLHHPTTFRKHTTEISSMSAQAPVMASR